VAAVAPRGGGVSMVGLLLAAAGLVVIGVHIVHPNFVKIAALLGMPVEAVSSAWKWSHARGLPFAWVLATIMVESNGKPSAVGDSGGRSKGLMQVNTVAHAGELAQAGVRPDDLHNVDTGIDWGTRVMKEILAKVDAALAGHRVQTPRDVTLRLAYKGPATVTGAIARGQEPSSIPWAPEAIVRWRTALTRVAKAV
jgi:hypothetical protein